MPPRYGKDSRSLSNASIFGPRTASLANSAAPGSFSSNLTATNGFRGNVRLDIGAYSQVPDPRVEEISASEKRQAELRDQIEKEMKIKMGSENLLDALMAKPAKQSKGQRMKVETELNTSNRKLAAFKAKLQEEIDSQKRPEPIQSRLSSLFRGSPLRSPIHLTGPGEEQMYEEELEAQSPTYLLGEILQALEVEGMPPDYYVVRANGLVELFKRHPTLKYDLAWSIFGLRVQMMLLSESREVIAAGYRVTRHAIADRKSLQTIRALQTDYPVILSLAKDSKATIEREQALKFVRAFLDVKDGVKEISNAVVRAVVSVAEHYEDRLRSIALLTLTEILVRSPALLIRGGGITPLSDALRDGTYAGSESIVSAFLYVTDAPQLRKYLSSGLELQGPFGLFSDPGTSHSHEERLKTNARSIAATINSWPGLFALSHNGFASISSLLRSLSHPNHFIRNLVLDLLFDILHIKPPSWTTSFLAGRRLTTYGRGANLRTDMEEKHSRLESDDDLSRANLVNHYTTLVLFVLLRCGLIEALTGLSRDIEDQFVIRKTTLLLSEVLKLADHALPNNISAPLPALPEIMEDFSQDSFLADIVPSKMAFQFDSVNRTLHRTRAHARKASKSAFNAGLIGAEPPDTVKSKVAVDMDEVRFRVLMTDSNVLTSSNYFKWKWPAIQEIVEGPLAIPKRLEDAKSTKFLKRLIGFYRPFKYQFSEARNTKPNERYVRVGCSLMKCLLKLPEGVQYLYENKLLRQLAECLAQLDRVSHIS